MSSTTKLHQHPTITYRAKGTTHTDSTVDVWELKASRRALLNLRTLLSGPQMLSLIQPQIDAADTHYHAIIAESAGKYRECAVNLRCPGIPLSALQTLRQKLSADLTTEDGRRTYFLDFMCPAHPEHYGLPEGVDDGVIEMIGEHMACVHVDKESEVPAFVHEYGDPAFPMKKAATGRLRDGAVLFYILHEFRALPREYRDGEEEGVELNVRLLFPANAPEVWFVEHAEHLALEFRSGLRYAYRMVKEGKLD